MKNDEEVRVPKLPKCDFCRSRASYGAKTNMGPWAYMCETHWKEDAYTQLLGIGRGRRLVVERDV